MEQTKPLFLIRKYRSILWAAMIGEAVEYVVSLTDSIVSGNLLGNAALTAIGLIAPFLAFSTFVSSIVDSGTVINYSYHIGRFEKRRALELFSQGIYMGLISGAVYSLILLIFRDPILLRITNSGEIREFAKDYYNIILVLFLIDPVAYLLDNLIVADGDEVLSSLSVSKKTRLLAGVFIEDILMLVLEKNTEKKDLYAECTIIAESNGIRIILRDSGAVFDVTDEDALPDSFRQFVIANMMTVQENKAYLTTTGYNRNELFFADDMTGA